MKTLIVFAKVGDDETPPDSGDLKKLANLIAKFAPQMGASRLSGYGLHVVKGDQTTPKRHTMVSRECASSLKGAKRVSSSHRSFE